MDISLFKSLMVRWKSISMSLCVSDVIEGARAHFVDLFECLLIANVVRLFVRSCTLGGKRIGGIDRNVRGVG